MEPMVEGGSSVGHEEEGIIGEEKHQKEASVNQSAVGHGAQQSCCWPGMGPGERRVQGGQEGLELIRRRLVGCGQRPFSRVLV